MAVRGRPNQARHGRFNRSYGSHEPRSQERQPESFKDDRRRQGTFAGRGRPNCSHCGENGHWVHTCYELNGYPMGHPRGRFQPGSGSGSRSFNRGNRPAGSHMAESSWARPAVNHVAESSWARPPANSIAETNPKPPALHRDNLSMRTPKLMYLPKYGQLSYKSPFRMAPSAICKLRGIHLPSSLVTILSPRAPKTNEVLQTLTLAMDPKLFNAAFTGDVNVLLGLIQEDPLILHTVTVTTSNTPLHVAALLGHAEFAMVAMQNHPGLVDELNQQGFSPIHLASAKGHWEIVRGMLVRRPDLALIKDEDGKNPLHTAATKGRVQVLREVFSIAQRIICCSFFNIEVNLLLLMASWSSKLTNSINIITDQLMIHVYLRQIVKLLVSVQTTVEVNAVNSEGLTALDIAVRSMAGSNEPGEIQEVLRSAGAQVSGSRDQAVVINQRQQALAGEDQSLTLRNEKYSGSLRNGIGVLAVLFSTISFQLGINPPGGSWEDWASSTNHNFPNVTHTPAKSIIWELQKRESLTFFKLNAVCFFSSLSILVVLAYTEFLNHSGSCALNKNRQVYWSFLLFELFGALLVSAAIEFVLGMALVTDTNVAYISSNICAGAWFEIAVFSVLAFLVLPFCSFVHGKLSR
ncbi:hypothetical protein DKX38_019353 [Salix brachista]|uniref:PGG domain-containing protein n=1 Tax=Salix brachista TaxID=2182728 RepID=A0A5N5KG01_9ROSI|nr:hypothetical protein DKX38_019353 [Salix brachista]